MIKKCKASCEHKYQDKIYGKRYRVHNETKLNEHEVNRQWRCTVCGNVRQ